MRNLLVLFVCCALASQCLAVSATSGITSNGTSGEKQPAPRLSATTVPLDAGRPPPPAEPSAAQPIATVDAPDGADANHTRWNEISPARSALAVHGSDEQRAFASAIAYLAKYVQRPTTGRNQSSALLKYARNFDRDDCLLRLVCEISSNRDDAADGRIVKRIRQVFGQVAALDFPPRKGYSICRK